jgi:hypothetical protein
VPLRGDPWVGAQGSKEVPVADGTPKVQGARCIARKLAMMIHVDCPSPQEDDMVKTAVLVAKLGKKKYRASKCRRVGMMITPQSTDSKSPGMILPARTR